MSKQELLFEIGTEELPAGFITPALEAIETLVEKSLTGARLNFNSVRTFGTPRRLVLVVDGLDSVQTDATIEVRGPKKEAAYDATGKATKALEGFARGQGVALGDIEVRATGKGEHVFAVKQVVGKHTLELLPGVLRALASADLFNKTMRWGTQTQSFARPIHWILALFGGSVVDVEYCSVKSGDTTRGHRFLAPEGHKPGADIKVKDFSDYTRKLTASYVFIDPARRRAIITEGLQAVAGAAGGRVVEDPALVDEVVNLTEFPVVVRGNFDDEFSDLPKEIVINAMREHQRYFSITDDNGALLNYFITVANIQAKDMNVVINGNERVLRARLNDAKFYFEQDKKSSLVEWVEDLKGVVFQKKLGSSYEKVERFTLLALNIGFSVGRFAPMMTVADVSEFLKDSNSPANFTHDKDKEKFFAIGRAAMLSKADLVSGVVGEFAKLQGTMGRIYAELSSEPPAVSSAIEDHYMPISALGPLPESQEGAIISLADKLDTIAGCFGVGLIPTGAKDPYALRRQALGIIRIILNKRYRIAIDEIFEAAIDGLGERQVRDPDDVKSEVLEFFKERFKNHLLGDALSFDAIDAVLSTQWCEIVDAKERIKALEGFKQDPDCPSLVGAFKRVSNILKGVSNAPSEVDQTLLKDSYEQALFKKKEEIAPEIDIAWSEGDYVKVFKILLTIKEAIDNFFDEVMVMVEDEKIKENRLALLSSVRELYYRIADLSKLQNLEG